MSDCDEGDRKGDQAYSGLWSETLRGPSRPYLDAMAEVEKAIEDKSVVEKMKAEAEKDLSVLLEAHRIVSRRNDAYGEPTDTAERVATAFSALTKRVIKPADVALIQILFKVVRSEHGYKRDNNVDLAGYTDIRERCLIKERDNADPS